MGKENPANIHSRGLSLLELTVSQVRKDGPHWLLMDDGAVALPGEIPEMCVPELMATNQGTFDILVTTLGLMIRQLIQIERFSTLQRFYQTIAYTHKFTRLLTNEAASAGLMPTDLAEEEKL